MCRETNTSGGTIAHACGGSVKPAAHDQAGRQCIGRGYTWRCKANGFTTCPAPDLEQCNRCAGYDARHRDKAVLVYSSVDDPRLACFRAKRLLHVVALQVIKPVRALLVQDDEPFVESPAKPYYPSLIPLQVNIEHT